MIQAQYITLLLYVVDAYSYVQNCMQKITAIFSRCLERKIKLHFLLYLLLFNLSSIVAQEQEINPDYIEYHAEYTPVTPNTASLGVYGNTPVNHATGVPQISIPLFTIQEDGMSIPISISYHASGIKVDELSSVVGLKWSLNAGGSISRQVNDKIDEIGWLMPNFRGIVDQDWINQRDLSDQLIQQEIAQSDRDHDYYPDDFNYSFTGASGAFIFDGNGNIKQEFKSKVLIEKLNGNGNLINFKALDGSGNTFFFDNKKEFNAKNVFSHSSLDNHNVTLNRDSNTSAWMLDRIQTRNNREISFDYISYNLDYTFTNIAHSISYAPKCPTVSNGFGNPCGCEGLGDTGFSHNFSQTAIAYSPSNQLISVIETTTVKVTFNYSDHLDASSWKKKLNAIIILDKIKNKTRSFNFTYSQFPGDPRLRLDQLQEVGYDGNTKPPYKFYYEGGDLPEKGSMAKDYHGFYNGKNNTSLIPFTLPVYNLLNNLNKSRLADRTENIEYLKRGVLNKIEYPTGGKSSFEYEANAVVATGNSNPTFEMKEANVSRHIHSESYVDGSYTIFNRPFSITNTSNNSQGVNVNYTTFSDICDFDPNFPSIDCSKFNIYNRSGPLVFRSNPVFNPDKVIGAEGSVYLDEGDYIVELWVETSKLTANPNAEIQIGLNWLEETPINERTKYVGGLRIKSIEDLDTNNELVKKTNYEYNGLRGYSLNVSNHSKIYGERQVFSSDNIALNPVLIKSGYFYEEVIINQIGDNDTIKTIEKFEETFRNKSYEPQMIRQEMYEGNHLVRSVDMEYDNTIEETLQFWTLADKDFCYSIPGFREDEETVLGYSGSNATNYFFRKNVLSKNIETMYYENSSGTISTNIKANYYDYNDNLQLVTQELDGRLLAENLEDIENQNFVINSNGEYIKVDYTYPNEYPSLHNLTEKYFISLPISKKIYRKENLIKGQFMEYDIQGNITSVYRYNQGNGSNNATSSYIPTNYERYNSYIINDDGKVTQIQREDGIFMTLLWDTSNNYLLAEIINATQEQLNNIDLGPVNFNLTTEQQNLLRSSLPQAHITTYTYDPLVGVTSMMDPKGYKMTYIYDNLSRLIEVRDASGKLVSENEYHYKNQN